MNTPDPKLPGDRDRVTNADEQEVVVNQSTREEGGYDSPQPSGNAESGESRRDRNSDPAVSRKRPKPER